ncbi:hypothetical protein FSHL1_011437 [Fusarium sambucinum]
MPGRGGRRENSGWNRYNPYGRRLQPRNPGGDGGGAIGGEIPTGRESDMRHYLQRQGHQDSGYQVPRYHDPRSQYYRYHNPQYGNINGNGHGPRGSYRILPTAPPYTPNTLVMPNWYYQPQVDPRGYQQGNPYQHPRPFPAGVLTMVESVTVKEDGGKDIQVYNTSKGNGEKEKEKDNFCAKLDTGKNTWAAYTDGSNDSITALNGMFPPGTHRSVIINFHDN